MIYALGLGVSFVFILFSFLYNVNSKIQSSVKYCIDTPDNFTVCCEEKWDTSVGTNLKKCNSLIAKEYLNVTNVRVEEK